MYTEATSFSKHGLASSTHFLIIQTLCVVICTPWVVHRLRLDEQSYQKTPRIALGRGENRERVWDTRDRQKPASVPQNRFFPPKDGAITGVLAEFAQG